MIHAATLADAPGITQVHISTWQTTYRGFVDDDYLDRLPGTYAVRLAMWRRILKSTVPGNGTWVAVEPGFDAGKAAKKIVGFVNIGPSRDTPAVAEAELYAIYVLKSAQKTGLGRALFETVTASLRARGLRTLSLWVLKGNPTEGFYRHLGGAPDLEKPDTIGGRPVIERRYRWSAV